MRLNLEMWEIGASQIPWGSGEMRAGQRNNAKTKSTQIALTSLVSALLAVRSTSYSTLTSQDNWGGKQFIASLMLSMNLGVGLGSSLLHLKELSFLSEHF